jgi:hypothetical protein
MSRYFSIVGFENLIDLLEHRHVKLRVDIEELNNLKCYDYYELDSGDYETTNLKIKVVEEFITRHDSTFKYNVEVK